MNNTPELYARGFYTFKLPWAAPEGVTYECLAIRSFEDIYKLGINVYVKYYMSVGITNGLLQNGIPFDFETESKLLPNIITLKGSDGTVLYIPDTYIASVPTLNVVPYSEVVLAVSLGLVPDDEDLTSISDDLRAIVAARIKISPTVNVCRVSTTNNPTLEEHNVLQSLRNGAAEDIRPNTHMLLEQATEQIKLRDIKINSLLDILREKGLINDYM